MEDDPSVSRQLVATGQGDVIAIDPDGGIVEIGETELRLRKQTKHEGLEVLSPSVTEHGSLLFKAQVRRVTFHTNLLYGNNVQPE